MDNQKLDKYDTITAIFSAVSIIFIFALMIGGYI